MKRSLARLGGYVIGFASLFALWHVASVYLLNSVLFPPPGRASKRNRQELRRSVRLPGC
jgi:hypothetical protein